MDATVQSIIIAIGAVIIAALAAVRLWVTAKGQLAKRTQEIRLDWEERSHQLDEERQQQQIAHDREMDQQLASMRDQIEDWKTFFATERDLRIKQDAQIVDRDKRDDMRRAEIEGLRRNQAASDLKINEMERQISEMQQESTTRQQYVAKLEKERDDALGQVMLKNDELKAARGELNILRLDLKTTQDKLQGTQEDLKATQNELEEMFRRLYALEHRSDTDALNSAKAAGADDAEKGVSSAPPAPPPPPPAVSHEPNKTEDQGEQE